MCIVPRPDEQAAAGDSPKTTKPDGGKSIATFLWGAVIGTLGGLIGLGAVEFRLPVLIAVFGLAPLEAVKASSLVVVASALPSRAGAVPWGAVGASWPIIANLLVGSVLGAWAGAGLATQIRRK